ATWPLIWPRRSAPIPSPPAVAEGAVEHAVGPGRGVAAGGLGIGADRLGQISGQVAEHADAVLGVVDRVDRGLPEQGVPLVQQDYRHGDGVADYLRSEERRVGEGR